MAPHMVFFPSSNGIPDLCLTCRFEIALVFYYSVYAVVMSVRHRDLTLNFWTAIRDRDHDSRFGSAITVWQSGSHNTGSGLPKYTNRLRRSPSPRPIIGIILWPPRMKNVHSTSLCRLAHRSLEVKTLPTFIRFASRDNCPSGIIQKLERCREDLNDPWFMWCSYVYRTAFWEYSVLKAMSYSSRWYLNRANCLSNLLHCFVTQ